MLKLSLFFCAGFFLLLTACSAPEKETANGEDVPWADASFVKPIFSTLTFSNQSDTTRPFNLYLPGYFVDVDLEVPDSLAPGSATSIEVSLYHPCNMTYVMGSHRSTRPVIPGRSRNVAYYADDQIVEEGAFAVEYAFLDAALMPINASGYAPVVTDLDSFRLAEEVSNRRHLDSLVRPAGLPEYVEPLLERVAAINPYYRALSIREFYKFFYKDTFLVTEEIVRAIDSVLTQPGYYQSGRYQELQTMFSAYLGEEGEGGGGEWNQPKKGSHSCRFS
ncbi:hypothetical protein FUA23_05775 [Neolewinella aurantiaca]|uniref:Lipoprotein n=1 Tax=Neolewinella aurantiaca TaxID=2602767 RepID=A0A5C7FY97_9BACT|nr:hypothetical protein [Neolewinella aurantiaca]TXF90601.1 hypothetical protein FUA23_05775 [Neolewinella aurantiaca]